MDMAHLFEVRRLTQRGPFATKWRVTSMEYIDTDLYMIINQKIMSFNRVCTSCKEEDIFVYEIHFHSSQEIKTVKNMFKGYEVDPILSTQGVKNRIFVYYDREDDCYRPYNDVFM